MQPRSIKLFTILYLAAFAVGVVGDFIFFDRVWIEFESDPEFEADAETLSVMKAALIAAYAVAYVISLLLWYFIAERRSHSAKGILLGITALYLVIMVYSWTDVGGEALWRWDEMILYGLVTITQIVAIAFLFRPEARKWFDRQEDVNPAVFE